MRHLEQWVSQVPGDDVRKLLEDSSFHSNYQYYTPHPLLESGGTHGVPVNLYSLPMVYLNLGIDRDFLFDQISVSFLKLLLGLSVYLLVKSSFSKNPAKSVYQEAPTLNI